MEEFYPALSQISLSTDGKGRWWKTTWPVQCDKGVFLSDRCQGVKGHKGVHWCFKSCGSFAYSDNDEDSTVDGSSGMIPPDHSSYRTPKEMQQYYHMKNPLVEEVKDPEELARYEAGETGWASVDRPLKPEEIDDDLRQRIEDSKKKPKTSWKEFFRSLIHKGKPKVG